VLVLARALRRASEAVVPTIRVGRLQQLAALALAACSFLFAIAAAGPVPDTLLANPLAPKELGTTLLVVAGGAAVAWGVGRPLPGATRGILRAAMFGVGVAFGRLDALLRRWAVAGISVLMLTLLFGVAMRASAMRCCG